jgi:hypothetical protein
LHGYNNIIQRQFGPVGLQAVHRARGRWGRSRDRCGGQRFGRFCSGHFGWFRSQQRERGEDRGDSLRDYEDGKRIGFDLRFLI